MFSGAVDSPRILLLSGIGPKEELRRVNIAPVHDLPGVGKNLHNHVAHFLNFLINDTDTTALNWATAMEYLLFRDGLMSGTGLSEVINYLFGLSLNNKIYKGSFPKLKLSSEVKNFHFLSILSINFIQRSRH